MRSVLVVDDDPDLRFLLAEVLRRSGVGCLVLGSYDDLERELSNALACDVALLDVNLGAGRKSGVDAYRLLSAHHFGGDLYFFTGHARSHPLVREARRLPRVRLLEKPVPPARLRAIAQGSE